MPLARLRMRYFSTGSKEPLVLVDKAENGVVTMRMNRPKKLNGWTFPMMMELKRLFESIDADPTATAAIITGEGNYYCAGVNLSDTIRPMHPAQLHKLIYKNNKELFEMFLNFQKPIIAAVNGPAIGASVTSATLCDAIVASDAATFSTPFARLGVPPEGCSSVNFERVMGAKNAERMLGPEAWVPTAAEAVEVGIATEVVECSGDNEKLVRRAQELAQQWLDSGKKRALPHNDDDALFQEFLRVNEQESLDLADAFFATKFLAGQRDFLASRGKTGPARMFQALITTRPLWSMFLPKRSD